MIFNQKNLYELLKSTHAMLTLKDVEGKLSFVQVSGILPIEGSNNLTVMDSITNHYRNVEVSDVIRVTISK